MPKYDYCCLCASDEGVFLDIFSTTQQLGNNRRLVDELETCLSVKVDQSDALSSKLCHKCAFELGQCNEFLDKYHNVRRVSKFRYQSRCCLCQIDEKQGYLFDLSKEFRTSVDPVEKIEKCFNSNLSQREASQRKICLLCRYSLDLLFDLKNLASDVSSKLTKLADNNLCPSNLPKTETLVVVRNTTHPSKRKLKIQTSSDSENDSQTMARNRTNSKKLNETKSTGKTATRTCGECRSTVEDGIDMYRVHQTGLTVCKMCWITMDPLKSLRSSKRKAATVPERTNTRLCTVYLKDVLCTASSQNEEACKIKTRGKVNTVYAAIDESSENETKSRKKSQELSKVPVDSVGAESSGQGSDDCKNTRSIRHVKRPMTSETEKSNKKPKLSAKKSNLETSVAVDLPQEKMSHADISDSAESDMSLSRKRSTRNNKSETKQPIEAPRQDHESAQPAKTPQLVEKPKSKIPSPKSMKTMSDDNIPAVGKNVKSQDKKMKSLIRTNSPLNMPNSYECKVCKVNYRNKIMGMKHELTHFKQLEIKIKKLDSQEKTDDDVATDKVLSNASDEDVERDESGKEATPPRLPVSDDVESNKRATRSDRNVNLASKVDQSAKNSRLLRKRTQESEEKVPLVSEPDKPDDTELHDDSIAKDRTDTESISKNDEAEQLTSTTPDPAVEIIEVSADMTKSDREVTETDVDPDAIEKPQISEKLVDDSEKTPEKDATPEDKSSGTLSDTKECATTTAKKDETSEESARPASKRLQSLRKRATSIEKVIESPEKRGKSAQKTDKTIETSKNSSDNNAPVEIEDKITERPIDDKIECIAIIEADDDEDCQISEVVSKPSAATSTNVETHVQTKEDVTEKTETDVEVPTIESRNSDDEQGKSSPTIASVSTKSDTPNQDNPPSKQSATDDSVNSDEQISITINDDVDTNLETNTEDQTSTKIVEPIEERQSDKEGTASEESLERGAQIQPAKKDQSASETICDLTIDPDDENQPNDINKSDDADLKEKENEQEPEHRTREMNKETERHEEKPENEADKEEKEDEDGKEKENEEAQETEEAGKNCVAENNEDKETEEDAKEAEKAKPEEEEAEREKQIENQNQMDNRKEEESESKTSEKIKETKSKDTNKEATSSSPKKKTDETEKASISSLGATDAMKEVIELAEAEVQKRADDVSTLPETLEDISNEINNLIDEDDVMIVPPDEENSPISVQEVTTDA